MEPTVGKPGFLRNILIRLLLFGVFIVVIRFAYVITIAGETCKIGDFCFFSSPEKINVAVAVTGSDSGTGALSVRSSSELSSPEHHTSKDWINGVQFYSSVFQNLIAAGYLSPETKALCVDTPTGRDVFALKEIGVVDSVGISKKAMKPLVKSGVGHKIPFGNNTFDFVFSGDGGLERSVKGFEFAKEIARTLKPEGFAVFHVKAKDDYSYNSFVDLFKFCCKVVKFNDIQGFDESMPEIREIVVKKIGYGNIDSDMNLNKKCSVAGYKQELVKNAEELFQSPPGRRTKFRPPLRSRLRESMSDQEGSVSTEVSGISEVKEWLSKTFEVAGKPVPEFEYTPRSVSHLHHLVTLSKAKDEAARLVGRDFRLKAAEYRSQAARIREILENVGLAQESLPSNVVGSAQVLANVSNLLNIRDTELSSFLVAMGDISLRKTGVEEKRAKVHKESKFLLDYTRKAIARLTYLKRTLAQLEDEVAPCEAQMESWSNYLKVMAQKERQYVQQCANYETRLNRVGYTPEISHRVLVDMAEHRKELERQTKPILDTLRSYQDLPPDKALAALAIEDKKRQYAAAEKRLEDVLQAALLNEG